MDDQAGKDAATGGDGFRDVEGRQDPIVDRFRPEPTQPAVSGVTLKGALGDSDRPGYRRLYFTRNLDYYAEFAVEDVLHSSRIPPEKSPFPDEEATAITLKRGANVEYTRSRVVRAPDEFDLDFRRRLPRAQPQAMRRRAPNAESPVREAAVATYPWVFTCHRDTCECNEYTWNMAYTCAVSCNGGCTHATCGNTTCTGCCGLSYDWQDPACGPSIIDTACESPG